jgi:CheY-like chemotaxis protein
MDRETMSRIYDPYFTTKGKGEGTGLGLSVVHGIVSKHKGSIAVESAPGEGTAFKLMFPAIEAEAAPDHPHPMGSAAAGSGSILLVDDEEMLVELCASMIEELGYRVDGHQDPESALSVFRDHPDRYDLVITDLIMPKLTGDRLAESILSIRPEMPVLVSSGGEVDASDRIQRVGVSGLLPKPFTLQGLSEAISRHIRPKTSPDA